MYKLIVESDSPIKVSMEGPEPPPQPIKTPILQRWIGHGTFREVENLSPEEQAKFLMEKDPAESYLWPHGPDNWEVMEHLEDNGIQIVYNLNTLHVREEDIETFGYWHPARLFAVAVQNWDVALKDRDGIPLEYRWFYGGWIISWDMVPTEMMDWIIYGGGWWIQKGGTFQFDVANTKLYDWQLAVNALAIEDSEPLPIPQSELDTLYEQTLFEANYLEFLRRFLTSTKVPKGRIVFLNGQRDWDIKYGYPIMFEQANRRWGNKWDEVLSRWQANPNSVLELREPTPTDGIAATQRIHEAAEIWVEKGGIIRADNMGPVGSNVLRILREKRGY